MSTDSFLTSLPGSDSLAKFQATFHTTPSIVSNGQSVRVDKAPFEMEPGPIQVSNNWLNRWNFWVKISSLIN